MTWNTISPDARLWIYTADRQLTDQEVDEASTALSTFVKQWTAHRQGLTAYADIVFGRFIRLAVDESQVGASGCSIDASVHFLQDLGKRLEVDFFDRLTFFADNGQGYLPYSRDDFILAYEKGELNKASLAIDTLVDTKAKYDEAFTKPIADSWHARLL